jgi:hypothetical protein
MFFFGPESLEPPKAVHESLVMRQISSQNQSSSDDASMNGVRKHPREQDPEALAQPAPKRPRKSTITNNTLQPALTNAEDASNNDSMEIDVTDHREIITLSTPVRSLAKSARPGDAEVVDEASAGINGKSSGRGIDANTSAITGAAARVGAFEPHAQEQPPSEPVPPPPTLTNGKSIGIQSEDPAKIPDLSPNTTILSTPQGQGLDVTRTLWRSNDSSTITGYGSEFCGIWNTSPTRPSSRGQAPQYHGIFDKNDSLYVSAVAWDQMGNYLAVATYTNDESSQGRLSLYEGADFALVETLPAAQRMITRLHWADQQTLIGLAPCDDPTAQADRSTIIVLWDIQASNIGFEAIKHENVPELINDLDSSLLARNDLGMVQTPGYICLVGENVAYHYQIRGSKFDTARKWTEQDSWTFVRCSNVSQFVVAASDLSVWIPGSNIVLRERHTGSIVDLQVRPKQSSDMGYASRNFVEEFATATDDSTIRVWTYDSQKNTATIMFKVRSPSTAISYSPDGLYFAGAKSDKLQVWSADRQNPPIASWDGSGSSWRGANVVDDDRTTNGDVSMNGDFPLARGDHSLSWDSRGNKIAFGLGEQVFQS